MLFAVAVVSFVIGALSMLVSIAWSVGKVERMKRDRAYYERKWFQQ